MLHVGSSNTSYARAATAPIAIANHRMTESAKDQRDQHQHVSAHHVRHMAKLSAVASRVGDASSLKATISARASAAHSIGSKARVDNAFKIRPSAAAGTSSVPRPLSSGASRPRKIEPTRFRYFCASPVLGAIAGVVDNASFVILTRSHNFFSRLVWTQTTVAICRSV